MELLPFSSVQFSRSAVSDSLWPHELQHTRPPCPSPNSRSLLKLMPIESVMPSNHLILCGSLLLPSIFPWCRESSSHEWPKYWSFSFSISPSNEHPGLISFRMDWLDLLAVQGTLKSLLQHHSSKASILQHIGAVTSWYYPLSRISLVTSPSLNKFTTRAAADNGGMQVIVYLWIYLVIYQSIPKAFQQNFIKSNSNWHSSHTELLFPFPVSLIDPYRRCRRKLSLLSESPIPSLSPSSSNILWLLLARVNCIFGSMT